MTEGICKECGLDHEMVRESLRRSLYATAISVCGFNERNYKHVPSKVFHRRALDWLQRQIESGATRILVLWPRDHLKTSLITVSLTVWNIIRDPDSRGFIVHKLPSEASKFLQMVRTILLSPEFTHYFPEIAPTKTAKKYFDEFGNPIRWRASEIDVVRSRPHPQATVTAKGLRSSFEGAHPTYIIADDIIDRHVADSQVLMDKAISFKNQVGQLLEDPRHGLFLVVGTLWPGGFYEQILENPDYSKFVVGCYQDSRTKALIDMGEVGEPIYPERFTKSDLEKLEREMGSYVFAHQYLNILRNPDAAIFKREQFRKAKVYPKDRMIVVTNPSTGEETKLRLNDADFVAITVDPATGQGKDETAIVAAASFADLGIVVELERWHGIEGPAKSVERILDMAERWDIRNVGIEQSAFQWLRPWINMRASERGSRIYFQELMHGGRSKRRRIIDGLLPWVESGRLYIREGHEDIINQAVQWNPEVENQRDDVIDALAYFFDLISPAKRSTGHRQKRDDDIMEEGDAHGPQVPLFGLRPREGDGWEVPKERPRRFRYPALPRRL